MAKTIEPGPTHYLVEAINAYIRENAELRRLLWLIVSGEIGYTIERADIEDYPGDDKAVLLQSTDESTGAIHFEATVRKVGE